MPASKLAGKDLARERKRASVQGLPSSYTNSKDDSFIRLRNLKNRAGRVTRL